MRQTTSIMGIVVSVISYFRGLLATKPSSKFRGGLGIRLYDSTASPCARRVRMTLLEKGVPFTKVEVNLLKGEQLTEDYKRICPNKKVPAISFQGVPGIEDCSLYESNVITEFLDADIFPSPKLYPSDRWERAQVKMWQDWELGLVDDFVPYMYSNTMPFILQLLYSSQHSFLSSLPAHISPAKRDYWSKVYNASLSTPEELKQHAIVCYQSLIPLEKALEGRQFLVGTTLTAADLSVVPRVSMYSLVGLDIPASHFPNIVSYLKRLGDRHSVQSSQPLMYRLLSGLMAAHPQWVITLGNWRSGRRLQRVNGSACLHQALRSAQQWRHRQAWRREAEALDAGGVLLVDCALYPECWQVKLLLKEKGVRVVSTLGLEAEDVVGHWAGSEGVVRVHHAGHDVIGIRAVLEYLDSSFAEDGPGLLPRDPLQRAKVQTWQAWECTLGYIELSHLLETRLVSKSLVDRYGCDLPVLLALQNDRHYQSKFLSVLQCFVCGVMKDKNSGHLLKVLEENHGAAVSAARRMVQEEKQWEDFLQDRLTHLDTELQHQEPYLLGQRVSLADLTVFCRLCFLRGLGLVDAQRFPHVVRWFSFLVETRPHFGSVCWEIDGLFDKLKE